MTETAIRVRDIGKLYRIGERRAGYQTLRESLAGALRRVPHPLRSMQRVGTSTPVTGNGHRAEASAKPGLPAEASAKAAENTFWALKNVSFDVHAGEIVGIIGRNGAGKSTLLKILSRITDPTEGEIEISGRVGSLLEVGTGFHPELTGRENVFLNGAILGMKRSEIAARFDEILAFAGTEKFLDTPVKFYSSGMYTRLAFAVAAHLEPEILIVDEVLSVGDAEFQKKCLGKMGDISRSGRTVLFVSHNVNAVASLCQSAILLKEGRVVANSADVHKVLNTYLSPAISAHTVDLRNHPNRATSGPPVLQEISIADESGIPTHCFLPRTTVAIELKLAPLRPTRNPKVGIGITNYRGERIFAVGTFVGGTNIPALDGPSTVRVRFTLPPLFPGQYNLDIGFSEEVGGPLDEVYAAAILEVLKDDYMSLMDSHAAHFGQIMVPSEWSCLTNLEQSPVEATTLRSRP